MRAVPGCAAEEVARLTTALEGLVEHVAALISATPAKGAAQPSPAPAVRLYTITPEDQLGGRGAEERTVTFPCILQAIFSDRGHRGQARIEAMARAAYVSLLLAATTPVAVTQAGGTLLLRRSSIEGSADDTQTILTLEVGLTMSLRVADILED